MLGNDISSDEASSASQWWQFRPNRQRSVEIHNVERLVEKLNHHRDQEQAKRTALKVAAAKSPVSSTDLLNLVNEVQSHERSQEKTSQDLRIALEELEDTRSSRSPLESRFRRAESHQAHSKFFSTRPHGLESSNFFDSFFPSSPPSFFSSSSMSAGFVGFERLPQTYFHEDDATYPREAVYKSTRSPHHRDYQRNVRREHPYVRPNTDREVPWSRHGNNQYISHLAKPLARILQPNEAKALFQRYSEQWQHVSPHNPIIPYPARELKAAALRDHQSLWSPVTAEKPSTWSQDTVMQANVQAFFLGAMGMSPRYTTSPTSGRIQCDFDSATASDAQLKALADVLKREKVRWHSDRIGRRNGDQRGVNVGLQQNECVRAVFHAVCELMEDVRGCDRL